MLLSLISGVLRGLEEEMGVSLLAILQVVVLLLCGVGILRFFGSLSEYRKALEAVRKAEQSYADYCGGQYERDRERDERDIEAKRQRLALRNRWCSA